MAKKVEIIPLVCPDCGAHFHVQPGEKFFYCTYCGAELLVDDGSTTVNINQNIDYKEKTENRYYDEAAIERQKTEQMRLQLEHERALLKEEQKEKEKLREEEKNRKALIGMLAFIASVFLFYLIKHLLAA